MVPYLFLSCFYFKVEKNDVELSDCIGDRLGVTQTQSDLLGTVSQTKPLLEAKLALAREHD